MILPEAAISQKLARTTETATVLQKQEVASGGLALDAVRGLDMSFHTIHYPLLPSSPSRPRVLGAQLHSQSISGFSPAS